MENKVIKLILNNKMHNKSKINLFIRQKPFVKLFKMNLSANNLIKMTLAIIKVK
jgi:hypothetical protein